MANMTSSVSASQVAGELASATFEEIPALVEHYREDPRQQVIKLANAPSNAMPKSLPSASASMTCTSLCMSLAAMGWSLVSTRWVADRWPVL